MLLIASLTSFILVFIDTIVGRYNLRHQYLLEKPLGVIFYAFYYALLSAFLCYLVTEYNLTINSFKVNENPIMSSIIIGITIKSIVRTNLFSINKDGKKFDLGIKTFNNVIEKFFERHFNDQIDEFSLRDIKTLKDHQSLKRKRVKDIDSALIKCLPSHLSPIQLASHKKEIEQRTKIDEKLQYMVKNFGKKRMEMILKTI